MNSIKKLHLITLLLLILIPLNGQNELSIKGGISHVIDRDLVWSPVQYYKTSPIGELSYRVGNTKGYHSLNTSFTMGEIYSEYSDKVLNYGDFGEVTRDYQMILSDFNYDYHLNTTDSENIGLLFLIGIKMDFEMIFADYPVANALTTLNIGMSMFKQVGEHRWGGTIKVPILTYLNRPPFAGTDDKIMDMATNNIWGLITRGDLTSVNDHLNIDLTCMYQYTLSNHLKLDSSINLGYRYIDTPREKWMWDSSVLLGITYDFEGEK